MFSVLKCTNGWTNKYHIFTRVTLVPYLQEHQLYKNQAAKFPTILGSIYSVLTVSGKFQQGWVAEAEGGQDGGFNFLRERRRDALGQVMGYSEL